MMRGSWEERYSMDHVLTDPYIVQYVNACQLGTDTVWVGGRRRTGRACTRPCGWRWIGRASLPTLRDPCVSQKAYLTGSVRFPAVHLISFSVAHSPTIVALNSLFDKERALRIVSFSRRQRRGTGTTTISLGDPDMSLLSLPKLVLRRIVRQAIQPTKESFQILATCLTLFRHGAPFFYRELRIMNTSEMIHVYDFFEAATSSDSRLLISGSLVRRLTLHYSVLTCGYHVKVMQGLLRHLTRLRHLELKICSFRDLDLPRPFGHQLISLKVEAHEHVVNELLACSTHLHTFAHGCPARIDDYSTPAMTNKTLQTLATHHGPHLKHLSLHSLERMTPASLTCMTMFPVLQSLELMEAGEHMDPVAGCQLIRCVSATLKALKLNFAPLAILEQVTSCKDLHLDVLAYRCYIRFSPMVLPLLLDIIASQKSLRALQLSGLHISDETFQRLAEVIPADAQFQLQGFRNDTPLPPRFQLPDLHSVSFSRGTFYIATKKEGFSSNLFFKIKNPSSF